jgi:hypothetical protein
LVFDGEAVALRWNASRQRQAIDDSRSAIKPAVRKMVHYLILLLMDWHAMLEKRIANCLNDRRSVPDSVKQLRTTANLISDGDIADGASFAGNDSQTATSIFGQNRAQKFGKKLYVS